MTNARSFCCLPPRETSPDFEMETLRRVPEETTSARSGRSFFSFQNFLFKIYQPKIASARCRVCGPNRAHKATHTRDTDTHDTRAVRRPTTRQHALSPIDSSKLAVALSRSRGARARRTHAARPRRQLSLSLSCTSPGSTSLALSTLASPPRCRLLPVTTTPPPPHLAPPPCPPVS